MGCGCGDQSTNTGTSGLGLNESNIISAADPVVCTRTVNEVVTEFAQVDIMPEISIQNIVTTCTGPLHIGGSIPPNLSTFCPIVLSQDICVQFEVQFGVTTSSTTAIECGSPMEGPCTTTPTFTCCAAVDTQGSNSLGAITITENGTTVTGLRADLNIHVCTPAQNCHPQGSAFDFHFFAASPTEDVVMTINENQIDEEVCNEDGSVDISGTGTLDIGGTMTTVTYTLHVTPNTPSGFGTFTLTAMDTMGNTVLEVGAGGTAIAIPSAPGNKGISITSCMGTL